MRAHRFTEKQKSQWAIDGYVVMEGLLNPTEVAEITGHVDKLFDDYLARNPDVERKAGMDYRDALEVCEPLIDMIDHPRVFDVVLDLLGPYIQLSMAEVLVRHPNPDFAGFIHTDGGQALRRIRVTETSPAAPVEDPVFPDRRGRRKRRQLHPVSGESPATLSGGRRRRERSRAGGGAAKGEGGRRGDLPSLDLARRSAEPLDANKEIADLLLQPDVLPGLRLRRAVGRSAGEMHSASAAAAGRPRRGLETGVLLLRARRPGGGHGAGLTARTPARRPIRPASSFLG